MPPLKAGPTGVIKQLQKYKPWPGRTWERTQGIKVIVHDLLLVLFLEKPHLAGAGNITTLWLGPMFLSNGCNLQQRVLRREGRRLQAVGRGEQASTV